MTTQARDRPDAEALAQETRQQAAHQSMLEMELQDALGIDLVLGQRRPERDSCAAAPSPASP